MTVLIGYVPTPIGEAALEAGLAEAAVRNVDAVILNSPRRGSTVDGHLVDDQTGAELVERARARTARWVATDTTRVRTSGRRASRVAGAGFGSYLAALEDEAIS